MAGVESFTCRCSDGATPAHHRGVAMNRPRHGMSDRRHVHRGTGRDASVGLPVPRKSGAFSLANGVARFLRLLDNRPDRPMLIACYTDRCRSLRGRGY